MAQQLTAYLGPEGSFTYAAALHWAERSDLIPARTVADIVAGVAAGDWSQGVVAIENNVEGYVVPSLDELIAAHDVVAVDQHAVEVVFDAFVRPGTSKWHEVSAHPHGLAQCQDFVTRRGLSSVPATSNAAACRDLTDDTVALGPRVCGDLYGLETLEQSVQDFAGARTRFLRVIRRDGAREALSSAVSGQQWNTMLAVTPTVTGPGVLARITVAFGERGVNMSSLITRPLKALQGRYVFVITCDGAPWEAPMRSLLAELLAAGDSVKTIGVFPASEDLDALVDPQRIPAGSVADTSSDEELQRGLLW
ncbi:prephenate dehydratase [Micrococcales bacterium KH10]|nr:prephenate dehydratase [Micrococcales bacterium KH10]